MSTVRAPVAHRRILNAVLALVEDGGLEAVSQRKVAAAAGMNVGSVRHHFPTVEALMVAAAEEVGDRMARRLAACTRRGAVADALEQIALALMPEGPEGRREMIVLQELFVAARRAPVHRPLAERMGRDLRAVLRAALSASELDVDELDIRVEHLTALIGGLSFEAVQPHGRPEHVDPRAVLRVALRAL